jgi:hypothetical protein
MPKASAMRLNMAKIEVVKVASQTCASLKPAAWSAAISSSSIVAGARVSLAA